MSEPEFFGVEKENLNYKPMGLRHNTGKPQYSYFLDYHPDLLTMLFNEKTEGFKVFVDPLITTKKINDWLQISERPTKENRLLFVRERYQELLVCSGFYVQNQVFIGSNHARYLAEVFSQGAKKKYARNNWGKGLDKYDCLDCACRHLAAIQNGEESDPELGTPHFAHFLWNIFVVLHFILVDGDSTNEVTK